MTPTVQSAKAAEEWASRQPIGAFGLAPGVAGWSGELVEGSAVASLTIEPATAADWTGVTGRPERTYLGHVLTDLAGLAVGAGILLTPEPGIVHIAYAHRDPISEAEVALGWGFSPTAAAYLLVQARHAVPMDRISGQADLRGADAVAGVLRCAVDTLNDNLLGPVEYRHRDPDRTGPLG